MFSALGHKLVKASSLISSHLLENLFGKVAAFSFLRFLISPAIKGTVIVDVKSISGRSLNIRFRAVNYALLQKKELPGKYVLLLATYVYQALRAVPALIYFSSLLFLLLIFPGLFLIYLCLHCNPCPFSVHSIRNDMFFQITAIPSLHYHILNKSCCLDKT